MSIGKLSTVRVERFAVLMLQWDDGFAAALDLGPLIAARSVLKPLRAAEEMLKAQRSEDGWSVEWPCGIDFGSPQLRRWATNGFDERAVA